MNTESGQGYEDVAMAPVREFASTAGQSDAAPVGDLGGSWDRCARLYGLCPVGGSGPAVLSSFETGQLREPLERIIVTARDELDRLHAMVRPVGYATLLADPGGVIIERYCRAADAEPFGQYGSRPGARWTEQDEGTNGIGTCIVEQRPLSVHQEQHFCRRHADLSCSGAPIFDAEGRLQAVLNVANYATAVSDRSHALALAVAITSAQAIEERDFRESHRRQRIFALQAGDDDVPGVLLAVDAEQRIVGADRHARGAFALDAARIDAGTHLREVFERFPQLSRGGGSGDLAVALMQYGGTQWQGLFTPPEAAAGGWRGSAQATLHTRPRLALLGGARQQVPAPPPRGGLPPRVLGAVRQHIEGNLHRNIPVEQLAATAGLSLTHFSRAFKSSFGVTPHHYMTQRRVDKAARLLLETGRSLAEIAQALGFSDQSHFSRCFTRLAGTTPSAYRHARR